ncbi:hypothetical protein [Enterococcus malodoratus]|uniref:hypothetical protein n=1 Tax=Enterococcus malodoratus TaxID=71451 RepID=UPI003B96FE72
MGVCDQLEQELVGAQAVNKAYKKHLEQVIEYHSVEKYRSIVQENREAAATAPLKFSIEEGYGDKIENPYGMHSNSSSSNLSLSSKKRGILDEKN